MSIGSDIKEALSAFLRAIYAGCGSGSPLKEGWELEMPFRSWPLNYHRSLFLSVFPKKKRDKGKSLKKDMVLREEMPRWRGALGFRLGEANRQGGGSSQSKSPRLGRGGRVQGRDGGIPLPF